MSFLDLLQTAIESATIALWKRRAQNTAKKNRKLRRELYRRENLICVQADALRQAATLLNEIEWTETDTQFWECPECGVRWKRSLLVRAPEHDSDCEIGRIAAIVRHAVQHRQRIEEGR